MRSGMALAAGMMALAFATSAHAACTGSTFATINLSSTDGSGKTSATVNGHQIDLHVDSGLFFSVMPKEMAQATGVELKPISTNFSFFNDKGGMNASLGYAALLKLSHGSISNARFIVVSGDHAPKEALIGQNILTLQDAEFDLRAGVIRLRKAQGCTGKDMAYWATPETVRALPLETPEGQLDLQNVGKVLVNGVPMRTMFSSGSPTVISEKSVRKLGAQIVNQDGRDMIKVNTLDIGGEVQRNTMIAVASTIPDIDMVLGADFFLAHRIYVSKGRRSLFFTANPPAPAASAEAN